MFNVAEWMSSAAYMRRLPTFGNCKLTYYLSNRLDVIGAAAFRHQFKAVSSKSKEAGRIIDGLTSALGSPPSFRAFLVSSFRPMWGELKLIKGHRTSISPTMFNHAQFHAIRAQRKSKASIDDVAYKLLAKDQDNEDNKSVISVLCEPDRYYGENTH